MERPTSEWLKEFHETVRSHILKADYQSGLKLAKTALKKWPSEPEIRFQYAKLLGDWADELTPARKTRMKKEAISILRPLLRSLGGMPAAFRFGVCLNYYYQSENFRGMVVFGRKLAAKNDRQGFYAQGVGAALQAQSDLLQGKTGVGRRWARVSIEAWDRYGMKREPYYFAHYCFALALAVAGDTEAALARLGKSAKLSRKPLDDWEFKDVMDLIRESERAKAKEHATVGTASFARSSPSKRR